MASSVVGSSKSGKSVNIMSFNPDGSAVDPEAFVQLISNYGLMKVFAQEFPLFEEAIQRNDITTLQLFLRECAREHGTHFVHWILPHIAQMHYKQNEKLASYAPKIITDAVLQRKFNRDCEAVVALHPVNFARKGVVMPSVDIITAFHDMDGYPIQMFGSLSAPADYRLKACVHSGVQTSMISKGYAKETGLWSMLDASFKGTGGGTCSSQIMGRIHNACIQVVPHHQHFYPCSLLVISSLKRELLIGFDFLCQCQCKIDFQKEVLEFGNGEVSVPLVIGKEVPPVESSIISYFLPTTRGDTQEGTDGNREAALEHNPKERVVRPYIDIKVTGVDMKALVDSGAASTIMSKSCAERRGLLTYLHETYDGCGAKFGESEVIGLVDFVFVQVGPCFYMCSIVVVDSTDVEFIIGVDFLRKHKCIIDLGMNMLRFGDGEGHAPFLQDKDVTSPSLDEERYSKQCKQESSSKIPVPIFESIIEELVYFEYNRDIARDVLQRRDWTQPNALIETAADLLEEDLLMR